MLHAKPGKEAELATFFEDALQLANEEPVTPAWFALKFSANTFAIFDAFSDDRGRQAHIDGKIAAALMARASELLAEPRVIQKIGVLAAKLPG